jgi:hypothetical protein
MIVIGVDVHKQSVTAVAADEVGRVVDERTAACGSDDLLVWAESLNSERLWALEEQRPSAAEVRGSTRAVTGSARRLPSTLRRLARASVEILGTSVGAREAAHGAKQCMSAGQVSALTTIAWEADTPCGSTGEEARGQNRASQALRRVGGRSARLR